MPIGMLKNVLDFESKGRAFNILRHASIQMTMRYAYPTPENMHKAVEKLGKVFQKSRDKVETIEIKRPATYIKSFN